MSGRGVTFTARTLRRAAARGHAARPPRAARRRGSGGRPRRPVASAAGHGHPVAHPRRLVGSRARSGRNASASARPARCARDRRPPAGSRRSPCARAPRSRRRRGRRRASARRCPTSTRSRSAAVVPVVPEQLGAVHGDRARLPLHRLAPAGLLVEALAAHLHGRVRRRALQPLAGRDRRCCRHPPGVLEHRRRDRRCRRSSPAGPPRGRSWAAPSASAARGSPGPTRTSSRPVANGSSVPA